MQLVSLAPPNHPVNPKILQILIQTNETRFVEILRQDFFLQVWEGRAKFDRRRG
jgi:DNA-binding winged helix-turn-helix (wHTH) protein